MLERSYVFFLNSSVLLVIPNIKIIKEPSQSREFKSDGTLVKLYRQLRVSISQNKISKKTYKTIV